MENRLYALMMAYLFGAITVIFALLTTVFIIMGNLVSIILCGGFCVLFCKASISFYVDFKKYDDENNRFKTFQ